MGGKIAVIGAGALGLCATKIFTEDGFIVTTYESREYLGGLWKDSDDSTISVHATTIFNSSKYRAAFSDFPFAKTDDDYPTATQLHEWLQRYARHFNLLPKVKFGMKVMNIERRGEKWDLAIRRNSTGQITTESFDKVCVATGSFFTPRWPILAGFDQFSGKVIHSIDYHGSKEFKDQNVFLVGMHATAQDVTNSLSENAKHVYLSHRGGLLLLPRYNEDGATFDSAGSLTVTMAMAWLNRYFPRTLFWLMDSALKKMSAKAFPNIPNEWGLDPAPSMAISTPLMADTLWTHLESRFAEPVPPIRRITGPRSIELENGRVLEDIDSIIYCTGYNFNIPEGLIPKTSTIEDLHPYPGNSFEQPPNLYRNIFPLHPDPSIRNSLAFIGQGAIVFPGFMQQELVAMTISQIWRGNSSLPSYDEMLNWRKRNVAERETTAAIYKPRQGSTFYPVFLNMGDQLPWLDETAGTDKELYHLCMKGLFTPAIWRLFETGKRKAMPREECRAMILSENKLAEAQKKSRLESKKKS
ncbi:flavin-containing monooxygenase-like protein [Mollisia scopiformis]|uniref:Flavin-containing monooxygenase-like protein n=1 Tax=Mollisia scopiformis TaxID=149040 RepID=A0A194WTV1_MOLSC|nr:flavin-containing monooxygenase-like protein [Mollisia scopiformis]KUJ11371.1 flavin-containing monooxygenase-like protein [Mollisia scopiformis]